MLRHHLISAKVLSFIGKGIGLSGTLAILLSASGVFALNASAQTTNNVPDVVVPVESIPSSPNPNSTVPTTVPISQPQASTSDVRFTCEYLNGGYTVMYHPDTQPGQEFPWAKPTDMGDGWTPLRRCQAISQRLEQYRPDGLEEMKTSVLNGYNIICVTTDKVPDCRIVLTVPPGQDPVAVRDRIFNNLTVAEAGTQTEAINTFTGGSNGINNLLNQLLHRGGSTTQHVITSAPQHNSSIYLKDFLDSADGGNGSRLVNGISTPQPAPSTSGNYRLHIH
jgi:hypothetical protein